MACRGVHFAITEDDLADLQCAGSDAGILKVIESIEEKWEEEEGFVYETDKAWDAIHRCLTDGTTDDVEESTILGMCILNGERLYLGDDNIVSLVTHDRLRQLADQLAVITPQFIEERYWKLPKDYAPFMSEQDCEYTMEYFTGLPAFFDRAEQAGRHVIFTVDQ